jgi:hypothetical protein
MDRYNNAKVYKLVNDMDDEIYVGSTCMFLSKRLSGHKAKSKMHPNQKVYNHLNTIGWDNVEIILIESYPCENNIELLKRERHYIDSLKPTLNKCVPTRTVQEWYNDNLEQIRKYREDNKDTIKEQIRKYREDNKDAIKEQIRKYREDNKDTINEYNRIKKHCDICDCDVRKKDFTRHAGSRKHQNNLQSQQTEN